LIWLSSNFSGSDQKRSDAPGSAGFPCRGLAGLMKAMEPKDAADLYPKVIDRSSKAKASTVIERYR
jgi:hypothetical protein